MTPQLVAFVLTLWSLIAPGLERSRDARAIAAALVVAVLEDAGGAPVYSSHLEDLAAGAFTAFRESSLDASAVGDGERARGPWQLHGPCGLAPLPAQARCWLDLLHRGWAACPASPMSELWGTCTGRVPYGARQVDVRLLAGQRERRVRRLLERAIAPDVGVAERQR